ncbi:MAG: RCC1 domain-containing protein [Polyangiaceae bacterium]
MAIPPAQAVAVTETCGCALTLEGEAWCWGKNRSGCLGRPQSEIEHSATPMRIEGLPRLDRIVNTSGFACGSPLHGGLYCWGLNPGYFPDNTVPVLSPVYQVPGVTDIVDLAVGGFSFCVIHGDETLECFGDGKISGHDGGCYEWQGHPIDAPFVDPSDEPYNPCECEGPLP